MRRILGSTTALSMALFNVQPWPLMAQTLTSDGYVVGADGSVLCAPTEESACNPDDYYDPAAAQAEAEAQAQAEAEAQAQAEAEAQAQAEAEAQAQAEAEAQAQAEAEAQAQAEAEAQAQAEAEAQAQAEAEAQAQADAEAQTQTDAEAPADEATADQPADEAVVDQPADEAPADQPADEATADQPTDEAVVDQPTDEAVAEQPTDETTAEQPTDEATADQPTDEAAVEQPTDETTADQPTDEAVADQPTDEAVTDQPTDETTADQPTDEAAVDQPTNETVVEQPVAPEPTPEEIAAQEAARAAAEAELAVQPDGSIEDPAAGLATQEVAVDPAAEPVEAPVPTDTEVQTLTDLMAQPDAVDPASLGAAETLMAAPLPEGELPADAAPSPHAVSTVTEMLTVETARSSAQEFAAAPVQLARGKKDRLSDLEKVGLVALGALVVGAIIHENNQGRQQPPAQVVSNTGDRVIILKPNGTYQVYKDDDAVLRQPGSTVRTETYRDGSTRTIVKRGDGTQIVTIRDATGRVLRRAQYDGYGRELVLIDDLEPEEWVDVRDLPRPKHKHVVISTQDDDYEIKTKLAERDIAKLGRKFSLRQIREIPEVRALAATIDVNAITFASGSASIKASEAKNLADLGDLMQTLLDKNPREMFLIEGHTDATGKAAMNLALSDRRAESVAMALTEYFDIPPENMVVQGYGESELLVDTQRDEPRNRRVAVRIITPLLKTGK